MAQQTPDPHGKSAPPGAEATYERVLRFAQAQHCVISAEQLRALGVEWGWIEYARKCKRLHRKHHGVYAVGRPDLTLRGRWMAAVLAGGEGAVLSHRDGSALHGVRKRRGGRIDITVPRHSGRSRTGLFIHTVRQLDPRDVTVVDGIPVTTIERTLLDLCDVLNAHEMDRAAEKAYELRLLSTVPLHRQIHAPGRRTRKLKQALRVPPNRSRSEEERRFMALLQSQGVPTPLQNVWFPTLFVEGDYLWEEYGLLFELDVHPSHRTPHGRERDAAKTTKLESIGLHVLRSDVGDLAAVRAIEAKIAEITAGGAANP